MPDIPVTKVTGIAVFACYQGYGHRAHNARHQGHGHYGNACPRPIYTTYIYTGIGQALCTGYAHPKCGAIEYAPTTG